MLVGPVPAVAEPSSAIVPCQYRSLPMLPPTPPSTIRDPGGPVIGGEQLGSERLAVPPGVAVPPEVAAKT
jgi:hypothetical protein